MDTVTYPDTRVADFITGHFVPARAIVKDSKSLVDEFLVSWTPNVVVVDEKGKVHYRVEGYFPPEEFLARLSLGIGKFWLSRGEFSQAKTPFEEVAQRHQGAEAAAEALYWLGVVGYKMSHDPAEIRPSWGRLVREHSASDWATRTRIPGMS